MASDALFPSTAESSRRRSTFYVPLTQTSEEIESIHEIAETTVSVEKECTQNIQHFSIESTYQPDLSACSFAWSLNDSFNDNLDHAACKSEQENKIKRYGVVLNASVNIDDDETKCHEEQTSCRLQSNTSTPIRLRKSRSRSNILSNLSKDHGIAVENLASRSGIVCDLIRREQSNTMSDNSILTAKDKSKTLPQNLFLVNSMPPKSSFLHHSSSRIGNNSTFDRATSFGAVNSLMTNSLRNEKEKSNNLQGDIRANTLPRYNNYTTSVSIRENTYPESSNSVGYDHEVNGNSRLNGINKNLIQIDIDPTNPINRKSPTPLLKNISCCHYIANNRIQEGSHQRLTSPGSNLSDLDKNAFNLGIPHNDTNREQQYSQHIYPAPALKASNITTISSFVPRQSTTTFNPSKMPMSLEDLEDLLNYADEQNQTSFSESVSNRGGCDPCGTNTKANIASNGSNASISQISNICSSGYQSIPTQSTSSSPVESTGEQHSLVTNRAPPSRKLTTTLIGYNIGTSQKLCMNDQAIAKADLPVSSINMQLSNKSDPLVTSHGTIHHYYDRKTPNEQSNVNRILNNNYVDISYDVLSPCKSPIASKKTECTSLGIDEHNDLAHPVEYFGINRTNHHSRHKRKVIHGIRRSGSSIQSESSDDERVSNTTSENFNDIDSLTTGNVSALERNHILISNGNDYDQASSGLFGCRLGCRRMPRTNPLMQYDKDDVSDIIGNSGVDTALTNHQRNQSFQSRFSSTSIDRVCTSTVR
uniref:Uncharacterized protein n=1 Tax=Anopheles coluzzii TaxID=1518534 RepID=A0A8W7PVW9_ANOCL